MLNSDLTEAGSYYDLTVQSLTKSSFSTKSELLVMKGNYRKQRIQIFFKEYGLVVVMHLHDVIIEMIKETKKYQGYMYICTYFLSILRPPCIYT